MGDGISRLVQPRCLSLALYHRSVRQPAGKYASRRPLAVRSVARAERDRTLYFANDVVLFVLFKAVSPAHF